MRWPPRGYGHVCRGRSSRGWLTVCLWLKAIGTAPAGTNHGLGESTGARPCTHCRTAALGRLSVFAGSSNSKRQKHLRRTLAPGPLVDMWQHGGQVDLSASNLRRYGSGARYGATYAGQARTDRNSAAWLDLGHNGNGIGADLQPMFRLMGSVPTIQWLQDSFNRSTPSARCLGVRADRIAALPACQCCTVSIREQFR